MSKIKSYRDLIVWQKAHELAKQIIETTKHFPQTEEARIIKKQLLRSSTSIPANIAEGYSGNKGKVYGNSLSIARRELTETDYWLLLSDEIGYIEKSKFEGLQRKCSEIRAMLSSIIAKINSHDF